MSQPSVTEVVLSLTDSAVPVKRKKDCTATSAFIFYLLTRGKERGAFSALMRGNVFVQFTVTKAQIWPIKGEGLNKGMIGNAERKDDVFLYLTKIGLNSGKTWTKLPQNQG